MWYVNKCLLAFFLIIVNKLFEDQFDKELFIGKSFADVFPDLKKYFYPLFKKVMDNGETQTIKLIFYKDY